ncbi:efflux RND transporter periplasmic adaptor subunit [Taklimakanibacter deserti]|uniref:efflux RND transporter periplasmic adaptor subunit n=1 Tax=Taklimakanibacter deserti TaxID=2267839 RepID=UPI0013C46CD9
MSEPALVGSEQPDKPEERRFAGRRPSLRAEQSGLSDAGNEQAYCSAWLALQCARISGATAGLLVTRRPDKSLSVSAVWPERHVELPNLSRLAELAYSEQRIAISRHPAEGAIGPSQPGDLLIAAPIGAGEVIAVAAVAITTRAGAVAPVPEVIAERLRWGGGWLATLPWVQHAKETSARIVRATACLDLLITVGEQDHLHGMVIAIVNDLATRLRCDRVSMGILRRNGSIRLRAISHSARFKNEGRLIDAIENAMEEAIDQRATVPCPQLPWAVRTANMAHQTLSEVVRTRGPLLTVVVGDGKGGLVGAITLERHHDEPFDKETMQLAEAAAVLVGPVVRQQLLTDRLVAGRIADRAGDGIAAIFGRGRPGLKLVATGLVALGLFLPFASAEHRVTAKAVLEPELQRAAVAPFDGYIRNAHVRAGDTVRRGDVLATLDDRDLVLDQMKWRAERDKLVQKQRDALAKHERTNLVVLTSQVRQAESVLSLAEDKLLRSRIVAPFDGIVVSGDLSQKHGSPVEKGDVLFEIAPLNSYRLIVHVDEHDVRYIAVGQPGKVALAGSPADALPLVVSKIMPVTTADEGSNTLRVEARLTEPGQRLQPGMEGVAKIETGQRSLLWIWTHGVVDAVRLAAWKYLP